MKKFIYTGLLALSLASCNNYLDVNDNPNYLTEDKLNAGLILPGVELAYANNYGYLYRVIGGYLAQYYAQYPGTSNYMNLSQWQVTASFTSFYSYGDIWHNVLSSNQTALIKAEEAEDWGSYLACAVMRAAAFQMLVDAYGEQPYSEALNNDITYPNYDDGQTIYEGLVSELDYALSKVSDSNTVCTNLLYYNSSNASEWIKLANSLKLRILMRMSDVVDVKAQLAALVAEDNFITSDAAWSACYSNQYGQANPFFQGDNFTTYGGSQKNVDLNVALCETMTAVNDARLGQWFEARADGSFFGGVSGVNYTTSSYGTADFCRPIMKYNSPVYFMTVSDVKFFLAEYEARYGSMSSAQEYYEGAIEASFNTAGVDGAASVYNSNAYKWDSANWKKLIGIQKWISEGGTNPFEGWCEARRLGYPQFGNVDGAQIYNEGDQQNSMYAPGTFYRPSQCYAEVGNNELVQRWPYAEASTARNVNAPATQPESVPVFWAK